MANKLEGKVIAITGPRKAEEMSILVQKQGGIPLIRPMQGTMLEEFEHLDSEVDKLLQQPLDWVIWTTGMGVNQLIEAAREAGKLDELLLRLSELKHAARGYKTVNALRKLVITPDVRDDDGSTLGLVRAMEALGSDAWRGKRLALQLHGDPAPALVRCAQALGASVMELLPYRHTAPPPEDSEQLLRELLAGEIDAVAITSAPQARNLFRYAEEQGLAAELRGIFEGRTLAAAVGKVTAAALSDEGVARILVPQEERMGALIVALSRWYQQEQG
ncbi:uroporphyrinogen-III synthase [Paenibacillus marinisediminis]